MAERLRAKPRRFTTASTLSSPLSLPENRHQPSGLGVDQPLDLGAERDRAAAVFQIALQRAHERMAVDDAGVRRMQRRERSLKLRPIAARGRAVDHDEAFDAVGFALFQDRFDLCRPRRLRWRRSACAEAMRHAVRGAELDHQAAANADSGWARNEPVG